MPEDEPYPFEKENPLLFQIRTEKKNLEHNQRFSEIFSGCIISIIGITLSYFTYNAVISNQFSNIAIIFEIGTLVFMLVLVQQFWSLNNEIKSIMKSIEKQISDFSERQFNYGSNNNPKHPFFLEKISDINKNVIDKLFDKLSTFSNSWLAVSGSIASGAILEVLKGESLSTISALIIVICSALLWSLVQNFYGILDYELVKTTKDLQYWWISMTLF